MALLDMRIAKWPIPMILAAIALTSTALIYVYIQAPPIPIYTDPNFTSSLIGGMTYLWRGAAFQYTFSADVPVNISYGPAYHLIYLTGPLTNTSLGQNAWIVYLIGGRPLYVTKVSGCTTEGWCGGTRYLVFKLKEVTPENMTGLNMTIWLPEPFDISDFLTDQETQAIDRVVTLPFGELPWRVLRVDANATHLMYNYAPYDGTNQYVMYVKMPNSQNGISIKVTNKPSSVSYTYGGVTYSAMILPYIYFAITPSQTTTLRIYVS
jgi:hypothetical protein